jgi:hypothetical protein
VSSPEGFVIATDGTRANVRLTVDGVPRILPATLSGLLPPSTTLRVADRVQLSLSANGTATITGVIRSGPGIDFNTGHKIVDRTKREAGRRRS